jgi:DNA polymerase III subunit delta'
MIWDLVGHDFAVGLLSEHIAKGMSRHAYLFTGPQGIGKRTLALRFFQAINCQAPPAPGHFCRTCPTCIRIEKMQHPDLDLIQAEQEGGTLKVDQIRALQRNLSLTPYEARYRMALLLRFEEANPNAANALLKTLEEPSPQVVLVLTAESSESLLPTIVSRCEVLRLGTSPFEIVRDHLQNTKQMPAEQAALLAHLSGGRAGFALKLYDEPDRLTLRQNWLDDLLQLLDSNRVTRFAYAESLSKDKEKARQVLQLWLTYWRDILLKTAGASIPIINLDRSAEIDGLVEKLDILTAQTTVKSIEQSIHHLQSNVNPRMAIEVLLLDLPRFEASRQ